MLHGSNDAGFRLRYIYHGQKQHAGWSREYLFRKNPAFEDELRFLRDHGHIEFLEISTLEEKANLVDVIKFTLVGSFYVKLREGQ